MPDKMVALLIRFLEQNNNKISTMARNKEFSALSDKEIEDIENNFKLYFEQY